MPLDLQALLHRELTFWRLTATGPEEVLETLGEALCRKGYVKDSFTRAVAEREVSFPTGLPTEPVGVAIPHADAVHVARSAVAVATLQHPVRFREMGNPAGQVAVEVVFMLAVADAEQMAPALSRLVDLFQDGVTLEQMRRAGSTEELYEVLQRALRFQ